MRKLMHFDSNWWFALGIGLVLAGVVAFVSLDPDPIGAQTVIRDSRATDTSVTPVLGRGYSLATNTYQSTCLAEVKITEPSYDFDFFLEEDTQTSQEDSSWKSSNKSSSNYNSSFKGWGHKSSYTSSGSQASGGTGSTRREKQSRFLQARLVVSTYYASVDESGSPLSRAAMELLGGDDAPGFFAACGSYYVKGITRRAEYKARFVFEANSSESANSMFSAIRSRVSSSYSYKGWGVDYKRDSSGQSASDTSSQQSQQMKDSNLKIFINGIGLGKDRDAALIVSTFEEYREALKKAFIAMQAPETGRVTSVELGAWAENAEFQRRLRMRDVDVLSTSGKSIPLYKKKDILTFNAEFIAELNRSLRQRQGTYYLARECRNRMLGLLSQDPKQQAQRQLRNLITGEPGATLGQMNKVLTQQVVDDLFNKNYMMFLTGKENKSKSGGGFWDQGDSQPSPASYEGCIDSILSGSDQSAKDFQTDASLADDKRAKAAGGKWADMQNAKRAAELQARLAGKGIYLRRWNTYEGCKSLQKFFVSPPIPLLRLYCMPELTDDYLKITENKSGDKLGDLLTPKEVEAITK